MYFFSAIRTPLFLIHLIAASSALFYAWQISQSEYLRTGLQFIAPILIIFLVHLAWIKLTIGLKKGYSEIVYYRSAQTAVCMALVIIVADSITPLPARAASNDVWGGILGILFCGMIIAMISGIFTVFIWLIFGLPIRVVKSSRKRSKADKNTDDDSTLNDFGSLAFGIILTVIASLEGLPNTFQFTSGNSSTASQVIETNPSKVWQAMNQATTPSFPLPNILKSFPKPVALVIDQGVNIGAIRKVKFMGREGEGYLTLRVTERSQTTVRFEVVSDSSPYSQWVKYSSLTYDVVPDGQNTRLDVTLEYERLLAPAWFFVPAVKGAAYLAMDVLARDVKLRSER